MKCEFNLNLLKCLVIILIPVFILSSCKKDNNDKANVLIPIKTGNSWTYNNYYPSKSSPEASQVTLRVGSKVEIDGVVGFEFSSGNVPSNIKFLVNNDNEGNFLSIGGISDVDTLIEPSINYKKDAIKGDSWEYQNVYTTDDSGIFETKSVTVSCIDTDVLVTTPKGKYYCFVFEYSPNSGADVFRAYISKNIGLVKSEHYEDGNLFSYAALSDYNLK